MEPRYREVSMDQKNVRCIETSSYRSLRYRGSTVLISDYNNKISHYFFFFQNNYLYTLFRTKRVLGGRLRALFRMPNLEVDLVEKAFDAAGRKPVASPLPFIFWIEFRYEFQKNILKVSYIKQNNNLKWL